VPDLRSLLGVARRGLVAEANIWRSLGRWLVRRPSVPAGAEPVGYSREAAPVIWLWIFASAVEMVIVHLLIPWDTVRVVVLVVSLWGLLWMVGLLASLRAYPHLVAADGLRVRHGPSVDLHLPWGGIAGVTAVSRDLPSSIWTLQCTDTAAGTELSVAVSGRTNVRVSLGRPRIFGTRQAPTEVTAVSFHVDDPRAFVTRARRAVTAVSDA
jgi:hypothetical protein